MKTMICGDSKRLLEAHVLPGHVMGGATEVSGDCWIIDLDEEVYDRLMLLDSNIDKAIEIACSNTSKGTLQ